MQASGGTHSWVIAMPIEANASEVRSHARKVRSATQYHQHAIAQIQRERISSPRAK